MITFEDALLAAGLKRTPQVAAKDGAAAEAEVQAALDAVRVRVQAGIDARQMPVTVLQELEAIDAAAGGCISRAGNGAWPGVEQHQPARDAKPHSRGQGTDLRELELARLLPAVRHDTDHRTHDLAARADDHANHHANALSRLPRPG